MKPSVEHANLKKIHKLKRELREEARGVSNGTAEVGHKLAQILAQDPQGTSGNALEQISIGEYARWQLDILRNMAGLGKPRIHRAYHPEKHQS